MVELASLNDHGLKVTAKTFTHKNPVTVAEEKNYSHRNPLKNALW